MTARPALLLTLLVLLLTPWPAGATEPDPLGVWPLFPQPEVVGGFDPPADPWGAGHRGVDLRGSPGPPVRAALPRLIHPDRMADEAFVRSVLDQMERVGVDGYAREQEAIINRPDSRPGLPAIRCPTLVLCGRQDLLTPPALHEEMAAAIPGARLVLLEDCGHLSAMEQPQAVTALMRDWLLRD